MPVQKKVSFLDKEIGDEIVRVRYNQRTCSVYLTSSPHRSLPLTLCQRAPVLVAVQSIVHSEEEKKTRGFYFNWLLFKHHW